MLCTLGVGQNAFTYMSSFPLKFLLESFSVFSTMLSVGDVKRLMPQPLPQSSDSPLPSSSGVEQIWTPFHTGHLSQHNLLFSTTHSFLVLFSPPSTFSYLCSLKPTFPEKVMAPDSSTLACKIPWTEEPGRLQSMGSQRVGHNWTTSLTFHFPALEKEMATHSSVLAWRIPGTREPSGLPSMGSHRVGHNWSDAAAAAAGLLDGEGNGTPLQYSCLENPMGRGAW